MSSKKTVTTKKEEKNDGLEKVKSFFIKVKDIVIKFLRNHWDILLINVIVFILTVFLESKLYDYNLTFMGVLSALVFIVVPTVLIGLKRNIKNKDVLIGIPFLYILFLIFLDYCTIRELYGINTLGIDKFPNYIDALMVVFIFVFVEYITLVVINKIKNKSNTKVETTKKKDKKEVTKKKIKK